MEIVADNLGILCIIRDSKDANSKPYQCYGVKDKNGKVTPLRGQKGYVFLNDLIVENIQLRKKIGEI